MQETVYAILKYPNIHIYNKDKKKIMIAETDLKWWFFRKKRFEKKRGEFFAQIPFLHDKTIKAMSWEAWENDSSLDEVGDVNLQYQKDVEDSLLEEDLSNYKEDNDIGFLSK